MSSTTYINFYFVNNAQDFFCFRFSSFGIISKRPRVVSRRQIQSVSAISYVMSAVKYKSWYNEQSVTFLGCKENQVNTSKDKDHFRWNPNCHLQDYDIVFRGRWRNNTLLPLSRQNNVLFLLLLLMLPLQPTMGFSLLGDFLPFRPFLDQFSPPSYSLRLDIFLSVFNPSFPWSSSDSPTHWLPF